MVTIRLWFDAGFWPHTREYRAGAVARCGQSGCLVWFGSEAGGPVANSMLAELRALVFSLESLRDLSESPYWGRLLLYGDCTGVTRLVRAVRRNPAHPAKPCYLKLARQADRLIRQLAVPTVILSVPRACNREAHAVARGKIPEFFLDKDG